MKSIFLGTRFEAFTVLSSLTNVRLVITKKNSFVDKFIDKKKFNVLFFSNDKKKQIFKIIKNTKCKLIFSSGFPYKLPKNILNKNKIFINSHPSLLPKYKGYSAIKDALKKNEKVLGCTVHYMNEKLDDGKIIYQKKFFLENNKDIDAIYKKLFSIVEPQTIKVALKKII